MIQTFQKKPIKVQAIQYDGSVKSADEIIQWAVEYGVKITQLGTLLHVHTLEGQMEAHPLDWIIKGVANEFYPCKPEVFEASYDPGEFVVEVMDVPMEMQKERDRMVEVMNKLAGSDDAVAGAITTNNSLATLGEALMQRYRSDAINQAAKAQQAASFDESMRRRAAHQRNVAERQTEAARIKKLLSDMIK